MHEYRAQFNNNIDLSLERCSRFHIIPHFPLKPPAWLLPLFPVPVLLSRSLLLFCLLTLAAILGEREPEYLEMRPQATFLQKVVIELSEQAELHSAETLRC